MIRNCFVREEGQHLVIGAGIPERWLAQDEAISFGPAPTSFGTISLSIVRKPGGLAKVSWQAEWHGAPPPMELRLCGYPPTTVGGEQNSVCLSREETRA